VKYSGGFGIALLLNALISLAVGMVARSIGKREDLVIGLGLLLGPLGALAGLVVSPRHT
jgi:hypothetical protein